MTISSHAAQNVTKLSSYEEVVADYDGELKKVEEAIRSNFQSDVAMIPQISSYLIGGGGKRIRPLLILVSSGLCGYTGSERHIVLGVVAEYIHAATLLHDDVVDEANLRRGSESANIKFGNEAAVLVGDFLFAQAFRMMSDDNDIRVIRAMSEATKKLAEGEILQLVNTCDTGIDEKRYFDTIYRKTGALMESCCRIGAIIGGVDKESEEAVASYGKNIGIAFQLMDDLLDYTADGRKWGKPIGADLMEGKMTLPLILALEKADDDEKILIETAINSEQGDSLDIESVVNILKKHGSIDATYNLARKYVNNAKANLNSFPQVKQRLALSAIADYVTERKV